MAKRKRLTFPSKIFITQRKDDEDTWYEAITEAERFAEIGETIVVGEYNLAAVKTVKAKIEMEAV